MTQERQTPNSSLRNNIMIAFFLAIVLFGVSVTATSQHILRHALANAGFSQDVIRHIGRHFIQVLTGSTIVGVALALGVAALISKSITEPIRRLLSGVTKIGAGQLDTRIDLANDDEFGQLAQAFNGMTNELRESYEHLEEKVDRKSVV